jgi:hypothetical protein
MIVEEKRAWIERVGWQLQGKGGDDTLVREKEHLQHLVRPDWSPL